MRNLEVSCVLACDGEGEAPWLKGTAGGSGKGQQGQSFICVIYTSREPESQEEREKGRINPLSCLLALYLLESDSLTSIMLPNKPANAAASSAPDPSSLLKLWWPVLGQSPASTLRMSRQYDPKLKP